MSEARNSSLGATVVDFSRRHCHLGQAVPSIQGETYRVWIFPCPSLHSSVRLESINEARSTLPRVENMREGAGDLIDTLSEAYKYRTTSQISDQTFCLASIAGFDMREIVDAESHEEKMKIFLIQIRHLPKGIIFYKGPKLNLENLCWAASSFMLPSRTQSLFSLTEDDTTRAVCTYSGLEAQWPGFLLEFPSTATPQMDLYFFQYDEYWVIMHSVDLMQKTMHDSVPDAEDVVSWKRIHVMPRTGLLVPNLDRLQKMGLIVSIVKDKSANSDVVTAKSVLVVSTMLVPVAEIDIFDPSQLDGNKAIEIKGTPLQDDTIWSLK